MFIRFLALQMDMNLGGKFVARRLFELVDEHLPNDLKILPLIAAGKAAVRPDSQEPTPD
jgi:hypothetical protein